MKKTIILTLTLVLMLSFNVFAEGDNYKMDENGNLIKVDENFDNTVNVKVNGIDVKFKDAKPFINSENRTVVPVRFVAEALGAKVDWKGETRTVIIDQEQKHIELVIGAMEATVDSETVKFDTKAEIYFDRTFVPLRFVSEALGATVGWNGETRTVTIDTTEKESLTPQEKPLAKNVKEMIKELKDEELKEVVKSVPNTYVTSGFVHYNSDGITQGYTQEITIQGGNEDNSKTLIAVYPVIYNKDYSVLKNMLKVYYPSKVETVYAYVSDIIDNAEPTTKKAEEFTYDGRSFACRKLEGSVSIYIGGKTNE
jgi:hypothetical protein